MNTTSFLSHKANIAKTAAILTIIGALAIGNASGVFATFWRTIGGDPNALEYGYGYGSFGYGYGYGYGYGVDHNAGYYQVNSSGSNFENPYIVDSTTFTSVVSVVGPRSAATQVKLESPAVFNPSGNSRVTLPDELIITGSGGSTINVDGVTSSVPSSPLLALESSETVNGVLSFGFTNQSLHFSKPVKIEIPTTTTASLIAVKVSHAGGAYGNASLTNNPNATCTNGVASDITSTATVSGGIATVYTCAASQFVTYVSTSASTGGGGAPLVSSLPSASGSTTVTENLSVIPNETHTFTKPAIVLTNTSQIKFTDISKNWAKDYIHRLVIRGIINNTLQYNPDSALTRAEFLKIAMKAAGMTSDKTTTPFADVKSTDWYAGYVSLAVEKNIISSQNASFRPNDTISRAEVAKIMVNIFGTKVTELNNSTFSDVDASSDLAKYIEKAVELGIFNGQTVAGKKVFRPMDSITRAEIAKVVANAFKL